MNSTKEINARLVDIADEIDAVAIVAANENRELSQEETDQIFALDAEGESLKVKLEQAAKVEEAKTRIVARRMAAAEASAKPVAAVVSNVHVGVESSDLIPKAWRKRSGYSFASKYIKDKDEAYMSAMYVASMMDAKQLPKMSAVIAEAREFFASQNITTDADGGYTVPSPLSNQLINLLEMYGVAREKMRRVPMGANTLDVPKLGAAGHATVYYPAEEGSITESDLTFSQTTLTCQKVAALVKMSTEITEDSLIGMMDTVIQSIAYSTAIAEDENLFNGVTGGVLATGIKGNASVDDTNVASVAALALTDLTACSVGSDQVQGAQNEWYMNPTLFHGQVRDLLNAAGGNTLVNLENGQRPLLFGYPVNFVNAMPGNSASASGDLLVAFGDMSLAAYFGDRRSQNFQVLNELYAENDQVGVKMTERIAMTICNPEVLAKITIT